MPQQDNGIFAGIQEFKTGSIGTTITILNLRILFGL